jgi:RNA polymerase sigma-70 factor, ECF subfamily
MNPSLRLPGKAAYYADGKLVAAMLRGDERAFQTFFDSYFPRLYRFAMRRLGNVEAARDVAQSTLIKATSALAQYRQEAALFSWLCQICTTQIVDSIRANRRHAQHVVLHGEPARVAMESVTAPGEHQPHDACLDVELSRLIQDVLDGLPGKCGDVLRWKYMDELSVDEIGKRLGTGQTAAQSMLARARVAFRFSLQTVLGGDAVDVLTTIMTSRAKRSERVRPVTATARNPSGALLSSAIPVDIRHAAS